MEAKGKRHIGDGKQYEKFFVPSRHRSVEVFKDADTDDTVGFIVKTIDDTLWQTRKFAPFIQGDSLDDTCSKLWHFLYENVDYQLDTEGIEEIESPNRIWENRETDCDGYATFISSVLTNLGIPHKLRVTAYGGGWQHIYIVVPRDGNPKKDLDRHSNRKAYIVIDPVTDAYDFEAPYSKKFDTPMQINSLSGLGSMPTVAEPEIIHSFLDPATGKTFGRDAEGNIYVYQPDGVNGLGELGTWGIFKAVAKVVTAPIKAVATVVKTVVDTTFDVVNKIPGVYAAANKAGQILAPVVKFVNRYLNPATILLRNGWLLCMKINLFHVAEGVRWGYADYATAKAKMAMTVEDHNKIKAELVKVEKTYVDFGGKADNMRRCILNGKGNKDGLIPRDPTAITEVNDQEELEALAADPETINMLAGLVLSGIRGELGSTGLGGLLMKAHRGELEPAHAKSLLSGLHGLSGQEMRGLGELGIIPAVAIAAATAAVSAVGAVLAPIMANISKNKDIAAAKAQADAVAAQAAAAAEQAKAQQAAQQQALLEAQAKQTAAAAAQAQVIAETRAATAAIAQKNATATGKPATGLSTTTTALIAASLVAIAGGVAYANSQNS